MRPFLYLFACLIFNISSLKTASAAEVIKVAGDREKILLMSDGSVYSWHSTKVDLAKISLPGKVVDVAIGKRSYAVLDDGSVLTWENKTGAIPLKLTGISNAIQIISHGNTALALLRDGQVMAWGSRIYGMRGDGQFAKYYEEVGVFNMTPTFVPGVENITQISMGSEHVLALRADGRVLAWGSNHYGGLGRAPRQEPPIDRAEEVPGLSDVKMVAAGQGVSTALKKDGTVWVWGANFQAQFGNGLRTDPPGMNHGYELTPQIVKGVSNVQAISLGVNGRHTLVLLKDGSLKGWGNTDWGQLGTGIGGRFLESPVTPKIMGVKTVFACGNNSFAVKKDGTFWAWGIGNAGDWPLSNNTQLPKKMMITD
jgi:alpha-tubulin suppressor-like RCC1 family protein